MPAEALRRLMLVEDDDDVRAIACMALEAVGGFAVEQCSSGAEALQHIVALESALKPQLILLDVMMPGLDGLSTLKALRRSETHTGARLPVLMLTGQAMDGDLERFTALGADGHVSKPVNRDKLDRAIKQLGLPAP